MEKWTVTLLSSLLGLLYEDQARALTTRFRAHTRARTLSWTSPYNTLLMSLALSRTHSLLLEHINANVSWCLLCSFQSTYTQACLTHSHTHTHTHPHTEKLTHALRALSQNVTERKTEKPVVVSQNLSHFLTHLPLSLSLSSILAVQQSFSSCISLSFLNLSHLSPLFSSSSLPFRLMWNKAKS